MSEEETKSNAEAEAPTPHESRPMDMHEAAEALLLQPTDSEESTPEVEEVTDAGPDDDDEPEAEELPLAAEADEESEETAEQETEVEEVEAEENEEEPEPEEVEIDDQTLFTLPDGTEATLEELKRGHLRTADYTQKTQALAEKDKQVDGRLEEVEGYADVLAQHLEVALDILEPQLAELAATDWDALRLSDPYEFAEKTALFQQSQARYDNLMQGASVVVEQGKAKQKAELARYKKEEMGKLAMAIPDLADPTKGKALSQSIRDYALTQGLSPEEAGNIIDHRMVVVLNKARMYDSSLKAQQKVASKKIGKAPKRAVAKGQPVSSDEKRQNRSKNVRSKLAKTGSVDDAAAWLLQG